MSPSRIEHTLEAASPLIGHACCIGDGKPYNTALIVLEPAIVRRVVDHQGTTVGDLKVLSHHPAVLQRIQTAIEAANSELSDQERIVRYTILPTEWTAGGDELTPTTKYRRDAISTKYHDEISALYRAESPLVHRV